LSGFYLSIVHPAPGVLVNVELSGRGKEHLNKHPDLNRVRLNDWLDEAALAAGKKIKISV
jgi:hypothetical protein